MDNRIFYKTAEELRQQCRFAWIAFQNLRTALNEQDPERVFYHVHAFLAHATMISRLLWPVRAESSARGERLRTELKVTADSPLALAGFRAQVERFDEAYEDWLLALDEPNYMDMNLMPAGTTSGFKADKFQRSLDPDTFKLHLRAAVCDLRKISDEVRRLESAIQQWLRTHNPW
jgi:hypothetical protein